MLNPCPPQCYRGIVITSLQSPKTIQNQTPRNSVKASLVHAERGRLPGLGDVRLQHPSQKHPNSQIRSITIQALTIQLSRIMLLDLAMKTYVVHHWQWKNFYLHLVSCQFVSIDQILQVGFVSSKPELRPEPSKPPKQPLFVSPFKRKIRRLDADPTANSPPSTWREPYWN